MTHRRRALTTLRTHVDDVHLDRLARARTVNTDVSRAEASICLLMKYAYAGWITDQALETLPMDATMKNHMTKDNSSGIRKCLYALRN